MFIRMNCRKTSCLNTEKFNVEIESMKRTCIVALIFAAVLPMTAIADGPSYNLIYAGYAKGSVSGYSGGKGYILAAATSFIPTGFWV